MLPAAVQSNKQWHSNITAPTNIVQQLQALTRAVPQPLLAQVHRAGLLPTMTMASMSTQQNAMDVCRTMLPKAREQEEATGSGSAASAPEPQAPARAAPPPPGARVVSAEPRKPEQGGLFQDVGLTRAKDTGGIGASTSVLSS